jgi:uncharacterized protein (DUF433 family)
MDENALLERITFNPKIFGGKPMIRGRRLAVEHVLGMLAAGDMPETIPERYPWLEMQDIQACLVYVRTNQPCVSVPTPAPPVSGPAAGVSTPAGKPGNP